MPFIDRAFPNFLILLLLLLFSFPCFAGSTSPQLIKRKIIALYNPEILEDLSENPVHRRLEVVLNHLGMDVHYYSILDDLPSDEVMQDSRAVVTWFLNEKVVSNSETYCSWLIRQMKNGVKWIQLEHFGVFKNSDQYELPPMCQQAFQMLGAKYLGRRTDNALFLEITHKSSQMVEFERELSLADSVDYSLVKTHDPQAQVYLKMKRVDLDDSESDLVFVTKNGAYVHPAYALYENKALNKLSWRINPFRFFSQALELQGLPRPDLTTILGKRVFMTHIDGDGIFNLSLIDRKSLSGEVIYENILKKYSQLPISVSIITGYLDMQEYKNERTRSLYQKIFSLDHVELASHTYAHPLVWQKGKVAIEVPDYSFQPEQEIQASVQKVKTLAKQLGVNKSVDLLFWSGDCLPSSPQIKMSREMNLLNINGGDSRFDDVYDSYAFLSPLGIWRNGQRQVYASFPNENVFTNLWKGPFYGFRKIIQSFEKTEKPIRIKPIDIYYHFYSGEKHASLQVLKEIYDYALSQDIFPVFISQYVKSVEDFYNLKLFQLPQNGFRIENEGHLKTIRFDSRMKEIDLKRSSGVIGYRVLKNNLYVYLDDSKTHDVFFSNKKQQQPYFVLANFDVNNFVGNQKYFSFQKKGWLKGEAQVSGLLPNRKYNVVDGQTKLVVQSNAEGMIELHFQSHEGNGQPTSVKIELKSSGV